MLSVVGAAVTVALVLLAGPGSYRVHALFPDAGQLVVGDLVQVGGVAIGSVESIELTDDNQAAVELEIEEGEFKPLHRGTEATIRQTSLSGVANRYVALTPGPNDAPQIPDRGRIEALDTRAIVDLDAVLNALDGRTRSALQRVVHGAAAGIDGEDANRTLALLSPAVSQLAQTTHEVARDQAAFERFLVAGASVVGAIADRRADLGPAIGGTAATLHAVAGERRALDRTLAGGPAALGQASRTLRDLRSTLAALRPALREAQPVAPRLARTLRALEPAARTARPAVRQLLRTMPPLERVLAGLPRLDRRAQPALASATTAIGEIHDIVDELRPYVPDVVAGFMTGFGGNTGGYYDANGHFARISFQFAPELGGTFMSSLPRPPTGVSYGNDARCPGAAVESHPDGSNPVRTDTCDHEDGP